MRSVPCFKSKSIQRSFLAFCIKESVAEPCLSRDLVKKWGTIREGEALITCSARTSVIRQFALFLLPLGIEAYIPSNFYKAEKNVVHILSDSEIKAFFEAVDGYSPAVGIEGFLDWLLSIRSSFDSFISESDRICTTFLDRKSVV